MNLPMHDLLKEAAAVISAAQDFGDALLKNLPKVEQKDCKRCAGKGYAHFLGGDRAPGQCFRCAGSGTVPATRKGAALLEAAFTERNAERLRVLYRGETLAISILEAAAAEEGADWSVANRLRVTRERREGTARHGKIAAVAAAAARVKLESLTNGKKAA